MSKIPTATWVSITASPYITTGDHVKWIGPYGTRTGKVLQQPRGDSHGGDIHVIIDIEGSQVWVKRHEIIEVERVEPPYEPGLLRRLWNVIY